MWKVHLKMAHLIISIATNDDDSQGIEVDVYSEGDNTKQVL